MQRVTISLDESLAEAFDALSTLTGYRSRSEAVRDLVRKAVDVHRLENAGAAACVANLSYVYAHRTRGLAARLTETLSEHHDLVVSTLQAPLDHETAFASTVMKGLAPSVRALADGIAAQRGVSFAKLNLVGVEPNDHHANSEDHHHHDHGHLTPHPG